MTKEDMIDEIYNHIRSEAGSRVDDSFCGESRQIEVSGIMSCILTELVDAAVERYSNTRP